MAKNFYESGDRLTLTAAQAYTSGELYLIGTNNVPGVALNTAAIGEQVEFALRGVYSFTVAGAAVATAPGDPCYYDSGAGEITDTDNVGANKQVGTFHEGERLNLGVYGVA